MPSLYSPIVFNNVFFLNKVNTVLNRTFNQYNKYIVKYKKMAETLKSSMSLNDYDDDTYLKIKNNKNISSELEGLLAKKTDVNSCPFEPNNYSNGYYERNTSKETIFINEFYSNLDGENVNVSITFSENKLIILKNKQELFKTIEFKDVETFYSVKIDYDGNVIFVFKKTDSKYYCCISNLFYDFCNYKKISDIENDLFFEIDFYEYELFNYNYRELVFYNKTDKKFICYKLSKLYYFIYEGYYYVNKKDSVVNYLNLFGIEFEEIKTESSFSYSYLYLMGLVEKFDIINNKDFFDKIKQLKYFKFNDTLNGALNYYDFFYSVMEKEYRIFKDNRFLKVIGNFNYKFKKSNYRIKYKIISFSEFNANEYKVYLELKDLNTNEILKSIVTETYDNIVYFCNLMFEFKYINFNSEYVFSFDIAITEDYPVKLTEETNIIKKFYTNVFQNTTLDLTIEKNGYYINENKVYNSDNEIILNLFDENGFPTDFTLKNNFLNYSNKSFKEYNFTKTITETKGNTFSISGMVEFEFQFN